MSPSSDAPRRYIIRFTKRAHEEVEGVHERFLILEGDELADEWRDGLLDAVARLSTFPQSRALVPESSHFRATVRQLVYRRRPGSVAYRVLFTIIESDLDAPLVRVLHLRHGSGRPISRSEAREIEAAE